MLRGPFDPDAKVSRGPAACDYGDKGNNMNDRRRFRDRSNRPAKGRSTGQNSGGHRQGSHRNHNSNGNGSGNGQRREEIVAAPLVDGIAEGLLSIPENDRQDGSLRDPLHLLRPARGNIIVPRGLIRELNLRSQLGVTTGTLAS